jgi:flagellar protein FlgJ
MEISALNTYLSGTQAVPFSHITQGLNPGSALSVPPDNDRAFADILDNLQARTAASTGMASPGTVSTSAASTAAAPGGESAPALSSRRPVIDKADKLYEQCEALETFLVKTLITGMRNTVQKSELLDTGFAGQMYEDMLYDEYTKDFTKNANFGLAELAYLELTGQRGKIIADHA